MSETIDSESQSALQPCGRTFQIMPAEGSSGAQCKAWLLRQSPVPSAVASWVQQELELRYGFGGFVWSRPRPKPRVMTDGRSSADEWWTMVCTCVTNRYPDGGGYTDMGYSVSHVVKPYGGWLNGFLPKVVQGDTCLDICLDFGLIWPRFI